MRIPCVKLIDRGELREDVLEMIVTASRLPALLGLDIRAFIATLNVARDRINELVTRYGATVVSEAARRVITSTEGRMRARLRELPDGQYHAADFLEHDGHTNVLYSLDVQITKSGDTLTLDFSNSSKQSPASSMRHVRVLWALSPALCWQRWPGTCRGTRAYSIR